MKATWGVVVVTALVMSWAAQPSAPERAQLRVRPLELRPRRHPVGLP